MIRQFEREVYRLKIAVLAGGYSPERDVSLTSGSLIANALIDEGNHVCLADVYMGVELSGRSPDELFVTAKYPRYEVEKCIPDLEALKAKRGGNSLIGEGIIDICRAADVVFLALHGAMGENGQLQATLDSFGIKYTGSGYDGSLLAMDKDLSKKIFRDAGVNTPDWIYMPARECSLSLVKERIGFPCVIKPTSCGSSVGVSIVETEADFESAIALAQRYEGNIIIEKKIVGRELTVGILDGEILPMIEIIPLCGFYDYENKYQSGKTLEVCPADIDEELQMTLAEQTKLGFLALRLSGYARFDFMVDGDGKPYCLEANTLPGMTPTSLLPQMAQKVGLNFGKLCVKICHTALKK